MMTPLCNLINAFSIFGIILSIVEAQTVPTDKRIDCNPVPYGDQQTCINRGCQYDTNFDANNPTVPQCYYPPNTGYLIESGYGTNQITLQKSPSSVKNPYGNDTDELEFSYKQIGAGIYVKIVPKGVKRYRPPVPLNENATLASSDTLKLVTNNGSIFSFQVQRPRTGLKIWDTSIGGLLFADKYIQIATYLPTDKIYGFGTHPFYLGLEADGSAHGVFIFNSNAQEVTTGPAPHLVYRTIGGQLEIFFFPGPTPEEVAKQYQAIVGTPFLPAYWALGFQLCRFGYENLTDMQGAVARTMAAGIPFDVAFIDINYMDGYKDFTLDPVKWSGLTNYTKWLHDNGMHVTLIFDPAVEVDYDSFQRAIQQYNVSFIEWPKHDLVPREINDNYTLTNGTKLMLGNVWPGRNVAFPDFLDPTNNTRDWWINEFTTFHNKYVEFDGVYLDMNAPSNFGTTVYYPNQTQSGTTTIAPTPDTFHPADPLKCPYSGPDAEWDHPPYETMSVFAWGNDSYLCSMTICMIGTTMGGNGRFYNTKNLYGWSEMMATVHALRASTGKRGQLMCVATFATSGHYTGHTIGDNTARWEDLQASMIGVQEFNLFGIPFYGADICGFFKNTNEELCLRWQQLGAFYSFSRNYNDRGNKNQDPAQWPSVAQAAKKANLFRYRHLPLHFSASLKGGTVIRPLFFEFPLDNNTYNLSFQYLWGPALLIAPVLKQGATSVDAYLPTGAIWYSVYDYSYGTQVKSGFQNFQAPWTSLIPVFVRGGYILPRQRPNTTTTTSRKNEFQLLIALDANNQALGELYWDDGESIVPNDDFSQHNYHHFVYNFTANNQSASLTITQDNTASNLTLPTLDNIEVFGYPYQPNLKSVSLNGNPVTINPQTSNYSSETKVLNIETTGLIDLNKNGSKWTLSWQNLGQTNDASFEYNFSPYAICLAILTAHLIFLHC